MSKVEEFYCMGCQAKHKKSNFYISYNPIHNGIMPICKSFIKKEVTKKDNSIDVERLKNLLMQMDAPFLSDYWQKAVEDEKSTVGMYFKNLSLRQNRGLTWKDGLEIKKNIENTEGVEVKQIDDSNIDLEYLEEKWGYGYTSEEYRLFEKKWAKLIDNYGEKTSLHTEGLITYIRFRVREELATAKGQIKEAKDWGALASAAAKDAKLNVAQLSKSDISGGVELLPTLFEAVESEVGLIPILPRILEQPYDDADMIIWSLVNYVRRLEDKPRVPYREIWQFYDEMIEEHCKQQGFNEKQTEEFKRKRNNVFRDLEEVYKEPVYEGDN